MKKTKYVVQVDAERTYFSQTTLSFKVALTEYKKLRERYGDNVRLLAVVLDYGEEV